MTIIPPFIQTKIDKVESKRSFKKYLVISLFFLILTGTAIYFINDWFSTHYLTFRSPIILQTPVSIKERSKLRLEDYTSLQKQLDDAKAEVVRLGK